MGELLITVLLVSILWMLLDLLKVFYQEHREGPGNEAVRDPGRQKLNQYAEAFDGLSETFQKFPKRKEDLERLWWENTEKGYGPGVSGKQRQGKGSSNTAEELAD